MRSTYLNRRRKKEHSRFKHTIVSINVDVIVSFLPVVISAKPGYLSPVSITSSSKKPRPGYCERLPYVVLPVPFFPVVPLHSPERSRFRCALPLRSGFPSGRGLGERSDTNIYVTRSSARHNASTPLGTTAVRFRVNAIFQWRFVRPNGRLGAFASRVMT